MARSPDYRKFLPDDPSGNGFAWLPQLNRDTAGNIPMCLTASPVSATSPYEHKISTGEIVVNGERV
jgi:hypothetical protein